MSRGPLLTQPTDDQLADGAILPSITEERFCLLIVRGSTPVEAHRIAFTQNRVHDARTARERLARPHIAGRIAYLRQEVAMRTTISLAHKRDMLAQMALGTLPSEVIELPGGKQIKKFQSLAAIKYDAKLSGEEAAKKIDVMGTGLKLSFVLPNRDGTDRLVESSGIPPQLPANVFDPRHDEQGDAAGQPVTIDTTTEMVYQEENQETTRNPEPTLADPDDPAAPAADPFARRYTAAMLKNLEEGTTGRTYEDEDDDGDGENENDD